MEDLLLFFPAIELGISAYSVIVLCRGPDN